MAQVNTNKSQNRQPKRQQQDDVFSDIIALKRVAKVTAGAKRLRFTAVMVVGDKAGKVGIALAHGADAPEALRKATNKAKRKMIEVAIDPKRLTIPHRIEGKYKAARVLIKPARVGTGVVAGGAVRKVLEMAGYKNIVAKRLGTANPVVNAYCTFMILNNLRETNKNVQQPNKKD